MADYRIAAEAIEITLSIEGETLSKFIDVDPITITITPIGDLAASSVISADPIEIEFIVREALAIIAKRSNWVKWSKIGRLDFTIDNSNVAGEMPLDWYGDVYATLKLGSTIRVYGANGVSILTPSGVNYGLKTIHSRGLKGSLAVVSATIDGSDVHFFVDSEGNLYQVSEQGMDLLGYSEFLDSLTNPVLTYDVMKERLYICSSTVGYMYSPKYKSFTEGPIAITGISYVNGTRKILTSEASIEMPKLELCTGIYDLGIRKRKTIKTIEVGTNLNEWLEAAIEMRDSNRSDFISTPWRIVNPSGIAHVPAHGIEFKFKLRSYAYEQFKIDYIKIDGFIHDYTYLDYASVRYS